MVKGLPAGWGSCSHTVLFKIYPQAFSYWNNTVAVGKFKGILLLNAITGSCATVLSGHADWVSTVTFSPNGAFLVSGSNDKAVKLWDTQTGGIVQTFYGHTEPVNHVSISTDSAMIASASLDMTIHLWDIQKGECHHVISNCSYSQVNFSLTDPQHLITVSQGKICQLDINGQQIGESCDGSYIAFSSDGSQFVLYNKGAITVQKSKSKEIIAKFSVPSELWVGRCCLSPDDKLVAVIIKNTICVWDITSSDPHLIETFAGHTRPVKNLVFSSPSSLISASLDESVRFWQIGASTTDLVETELVSALKHSASARISLQAKDNLIITSDQDGLVRTWDISTGLCKASFQTPAKNFNTRGIQDIRDIQLIGERPILVWHEDQEIKIWDVGKEEFMLTIALSESDSEELDDLRISGDGSKIFLYCGEYLKALSMETGEVMGEVQFEDELYRQFLTLDGPRVWVSHVSGYEGWDFGSSESLPLLLIEQPPSKLHPNGMILWNTYLSRAQDIVTGNVLFQLARGFEKLHDIQWNGQHLVVCFKSGKVLILDFSHMFPQ